MPQTLTNDSDSKPLNFIQFHHAHGGAAPAPGPAAAASPSRGFRGYESAAAAFAAAKRNVTHEGSSLHAIWPAAGAATRRHRGAARRAGRSAGAHQSGGA